MKRTDPEMLAYRLLIAAEAAEVEILPSQARAIADVILDEGLIPSRIVRQPWTRWTDEEDAELRRLYESNASAAEIREKLGKTSGQIKGAVTRLKLRRTGRQARPR